MKAVIGETYGPPEKVLQLRDVGMPVPKEDEVLLKVHAAEVDIADFFGISGVARLLGGGMRRPKDPWCGSDVAGEVEEVGAKVTCFHPGDGVFGTVNHGA